MNFETRLVIVGCRFWTGYQSILAISCATVGLSILSESTSPGDDWRGAGEQMGIEDELVEADGCEWGVFAAVEICRMIPAR
jgi:hypothetical protein